MAAFDKLSPPVQKWIREQGWRELRDIQARAIHAVLDSTNDLIIAAATAGGKTEAAFLPLISSSVAEAEEGQSGFGLLYIGPLKALINDQYGRLSDLCEKAGVSVFPWHGDVFASVKTKAMRSAGSIVLITPESLEALFVRRGPQIRSLFGRTATVVIDELHTFLDSERGVQLHSLLTRLELATGRRIRRIGLSATLGDMELARGYLRPNDPDGVEILEAAGNEAELRLQLRGYVAGSVDPEQSGATDAVARHLFEKLRGSNNLIFAGSRNRVEIYADRLRQLCEDAHLPQEFYPHHASLAKEHREFVEQRLKGGRLPTTAICTSTLELGIDIGDVSCVAQIGAPFTVASLRQRLGRSGRREGQPAILRQYAIEAATDAGSSFADRLRLNMIRAIAMIELLLEGWCEAPQPKSLHLSTLVHQILSVIAERGGASAARLFTTLCEKGPFGAVDRATFLQVLRRLGEKEVALIEQSSDGLLLLGRTGEKLVEHYSFYAVFRTPEEYRLLTSGKELGTVPLENVLAPGMTIIFSGRRWEIEEVDSAERVILVRPSTAGVPPVFGGDVGDLDDRVIEKMHDILSGDSIPVYLDKIAADLLSGARANFSKMGFDKNRIVKLGERSDILATLRGTVKTSTLALALRSFGLTVQSLDGFLEVHSAEGRLCTTDALGEIAAGSGEGLLSGGENLIFEKYHPILSESLLRLDALSCRLDPSSLPNLARELMTNAQLQA